MSPRLRRPGGRNADAERSRRTAAVSELVERFVYDLGLLIAGRDTDLDAYVEPATARRMRDAVQPGLRGELSTQPHFGDYAQMRIEDDLLDMARPWRAEVEFQDRSVQVARAGRTVARRRRRIRLVLLIDPTLTRVIDHRLDIG